jgi:hypothetical protein
VDTAEVVVVVAAVVVNVAMAVCTLSEAVTVIAPVAFDGTVKVAVKPPVALDTIDAGVVARTVEPMRRVTILFAKNPVPVAVTVLPAAPDVGLSVSVAAVVLVAAVVVVVVVLLVVVPAVNVARAVCELSDAITVCGPVDVAGTVKVAVNPPTESATIDAGVVARTVEPMRRVIAALGVNPVPVAVTVLPAAPDVGLSVSVAAVLVCAIALFIVAIGLKPSAANAVITTAMASPLARAVFLLFISLEKEA